MSEGSRLRTPLLAVDAIVPYQGGVVLIERSHPPFEGHFALPGGFVEIGETVEQACLREVREETGLLVEVKELLGVYSEPGRDPRGHVVSVVFLTEVQSGSLEAQSDAKSVRIFPEIPEKLAFDHRKILRDAKERGWL